MSQACRIRIRLGASQGVLFSCSTGAPMSPSGHLTHHRARTENISLDKPRQKLTRAMVLAPRRHVRLARLAIQIHVSRGCDRFLSRRRDMPRLQPCEQLWNGIPNGGKHRRTSLHQLAKNPNGTIYEREWYKEKKIARRIHFSKDTSRAMGNPIQLPYRDPKPWNISMSIPKRR